MNVVRRLSCNCLKNFSRKTSTIFYKEYKLQPLCFTREISSRKNSNFASSVATNPTTYSDNDFNKDEVITEDVLSKINTQIKENSHGRLFAVIQLMEKRFKITAEDIIAVGSYFPAQVGDKIRLEKVLVIGSADFTLLGRPVLHKDLVRVEATVIEKTYIVPRPLYRHGRLRYRRLHWFRTPYTLFRINSIEFKHSLDDLPEAEGIQGRVIY
ncbi:39S ribosomal protein L21, mitochondrial [Nephila pilipes]|uniref:Large ribosomal subunit protein bL21m n=1 Tax=Nephila pilipes TaxID=299642 RepID=A0A8X6UC95_NEPPI|nr:39S ribosomal protein L21, mitochondrial [Nephila pilipes]